MRQRISYSTRTLSKYGMFTSSVLKFVHAACVRSVQERTAADELLQMPFLDVGISSEAAKRMFEPSPVIKVLLSFLLSTAAGLAEDYRNHPKVKNC